MENNRKNELVGKATIVEMSGAQFAARTLECCGKLDKADIGFVSMQPITALNRAKPMSQPSAQPSAPKMK